MTTVLVVEDEPLAAEAHQLCVQRMAGFEVAGVVHSGTEALRFCQHNAVDVILLDFLLPDIHGLNVCRALRAARSTVSVIAVTSDRSRKAVEHAHSMGVYHYLLKPFVFEQLRHKLERCAEFRRFVEQPGTVPCQRDLDERLNKLLALRPLPKEITGETLRAITKALIAAADGGLSVNEAANIVGVSRTTAQRYLNHLVENDLAQDRLRYGRPGRPEARYYLAPQNGDNITRF